MDAIRSLQPLVDVDQHVRDLGVPPPALGDGLEADVDRAGLIRIQRVGLVQVDEGLGGAAGAVGAEDGGVEPQRRAATHVRDVLGGAHQHLDRLGGALRLRLEPREGDGQRLVVRVLRDLRLERVRHRRHAPVAPGLRAHLGGRQQQRAGALRVAEALRRGAGGLHDQPRPLGEIVDRLGLPHEHRHHVVPATGARQARHEARGDPHVTGVAGERGQSAERALGRPGRLAHRAQIQPRGLDRIAAGTAQQIARVEQRSRAIRGGDGVLRLVERALVPRAPVGGIGRGWHGPQI